MMFCDFYKFDPYEPNVRNVTDFLRLLLEDGASYSTINIARCALSAVLYTGSNETIGSHPMLSLVVKGCGNLNPPQPKYDSTWDVSLILNLFHKWARNSELSLLRLSQKLTVLLLLCTAQRGQTIWYLNLSGMKFTDYGVRFHMKNQLKHNKPGEPLSSIKVVAYKRDARLCPVKCLKEYLYRTRKLRRGKNQLLIKSVRPHEKIARNTVSSWTKKVFKAAGIDTKRYGAHSTRSASTSAAIAEGINLNTLLQQASWKSSATFAKHYNKPIMNVKDSVTYKVAQRVY